MSQQLNQQQSSSSFRESNASIQSVMSLVSSARDKWTSSGASDAANRAYASIPDSTRQYMTNIFQRNNVRGPTVFFGIGEERPFFFEKVPSLLLERVRHNIEFFILNYMMLLAGLFCVMLLTSPTTIIGLAILGGAWTFVIQATQSGALNVGGVSIPQKTATLLMTGISLFALMYLLYGVFWWTLFSGGFLALLHCVLRDASMHKDLNDDHVVTMHGDLNLETMNHLDSSMNRSSSLGMMGGDEDASFMNSHSHHSNAV